MSKFLVGLPDTQGGMSYLTTGDGDPPRCYTIKYANIYDTQKSAEYAIRECEELWYHRPRNYVLLQIHELKTLPKYYDAVVRGNKTFEIRKNDRNFKMGDVLILKRYDPEEGYTGETVSKQVLYVLTAEQFEGIAPGYCVLGLSPEVIQ